jgi:7-cyano-7-deazaguanine synthase in queuosine biosynthesis
VSRETAAAKPLEYSIDFAASAPPRERPQRRAGAEPTYADGFYVDDHMIGRSFGRLIEPLYSDWIDVALAAYYADRKSLRRDPKCRQRGYQWARRIHLTIPVRLPEVWRRPEVADALRRALGFFTDDDWRLEFVARRGQERLAGAQQFLFPTPVAAPVRVALLSGGLDSFAGAARAVADLPDHSFVFVSGATNSRLRWAQGEQVRALRTLSSGELCHITVPFGVTGRRRARGQGEEQSQRTRGFVFLTFGAVTALAAGAAELHVHENGVGAVNLPYNATQIGTSSSRGVHPLSLLRMGELAEALTGGPFSFCNPFLYQTKGQMCRHLAVRRLASCLKTTFSCDGFPVQAKGRPQCGSCTSCHLRRVSLEAAGLSAHDPSDQYVCDLMSPESKAGERQLQALAAMEWQVRKISQKLKTADPWQSMATEFPELQKIASELGASAAGGEREVSRSLLRLYARYVAEWDGYSARGRLAARARAA